MNQFIEEKYQTKDVKINLSPIHEGGLANVKILKHLGLTVNHIAIKYAEELGIHAATGDSDANLPQLHDNGYTIAVEHMKNVVVEDATKYLEAYAALVALDHTNKREVAAVKELSTAEKRVAAQKLNKEVDALLKEPKKLSVTYS